ncbi:MAG: NAD-dependent succinate-semialdehyde dehydrogenase [Deltaproteobacteria bacterium]|nr:NAD-dependent succinate-semialdehyde dehydrogenase [Deltaproteobacteria bacterium]
MRIQDRNLIGGQWVGAVSGAELVVRDPATDEELARVPNGGSAEARQAVDAATAAFPAWSAKTAAERGAILRTLSDLMLARKEELATLMSREQGKPIGEARGEIVYAASFIDWAADEGKRLYGEIVPASSAKKRIFVLRQPLGVCAAITPWNFPAAMITRKLGPALAAGNTIVVKPAEQTPLSALALAELSIEAGAPAGVISVVTGSPVEISEAWLSDPRLRKLSFTGSTEVGRILMSKATRNLTRLSLELGGHAPFVVFADADLDATVEGAVASKLRNAGQTCVSANRFIVEDAVHDAFAAKLAAAFERLPVGRGLDESVRIGPLVDDAAIEKVESHVSDAVSGGASVVSGGARIRPSAGLTARFFQPTVLTGVTPRMKVSVEETFGPVAPITRFSTEAEAVQLANDSPFGLAAYLFTRDVSRLFRVAERLDYGIVGANDGAPSTAQAPFGGVKHSGFGREGGRWVMEEYVNVKYVSLGL